MNQKQKQAFLDDIAKANDLLQEERAKVLPSYQQPIATSPRDAVRLAKRLSDAFKNVKITLSFDGGQQAMFAEPSFKPYSMEGVADHAIDNYTKNALATAAKKDTFWPSFNELCAYARGFDDGANNQELDKLRYENDELKRKIEYYKELPMMHPLMHPRFGSPWGG